MLILSRKLGESIQIGPGIVVEVVHLDRTRVRLGITAPSGVSVRRGELTEETMEDQPGSREAATQDAEGDDSEEG